MLNIVRRLLVVTKETNQLTTMKTKQQQQKKIERAENEYRAH